MDTMQAIRVMMADSGLTHRQIAHKLGKYDSYVSQVLSRGKTPQTDTLIDITRACGYSLQLVPVDGGDPITIGEDHDDETPAASLDQARALIARGLAMLEQIDA